MRKESIPSRQIRQAFTLAEIMCSLMIFAMVATAGTYMMSATNNSQKLFRNGATSQSEVEFALGRMVENVRATTAVASPTSATAASTLRLTSLPSALISNNTFAITYSLSGTNLIETYVNNGTSATYSTSTLVHNVTAFSVAETTANAKAFTITLTAGTDQTISRSVTVFGRNL